MRRFPVDADRMLEINPQGMTGAFGLMCALGVNRIDSPIERAYERAEWVDIIAKIRAMTMADTLYRFPVVRQYCGCQLRVDPVGADLVGTSYVGVLRVRLCVGHPWRDH